MVPPTKATRTPIKAIQKQETVFRPRGYTRKKPLPLALQRSQRQKDTSLTSTNAFREVNARVTRPIRRQQRGRKTSHSDRIFEWKKQEITILMDTHQARQQTIERYTSGSALERRTQGEFEELYSGTHTSPFNIGHPSRQHTRHYLTQRTSKQGPSVTKDNKLEERTPQRRRLRATNP
ncbi:hypothetical protein BJ508DRAFT_351333 [Ascobolus immersus RN42]|uniref:Uncharacterized protein n=1 Tax=Ascobolus immersus RN42 TaxID=1160509 RepID=A0A3N4HU54_ASCIM|nr:hypothetical protein BJ508DRAFT_351333 [Ascobolus immersus RN42]